MALFFAQIMSWAADSSTVATNFGAGYYRRRKRFMAYILE